MRVVHLLRKPMSEPSVAANVLDHGTGALNIDGCRVGSDTSRGDRYGGKPSKGGSGDIFPVGHPEIWEVKPGRWPSNVILEHLPSCQLMGTKRVRCSLWKEDDRTPSDGRIFPFLKEKDRKENRAYRDEEDPRHEVVDDWRCDADCPIHDLDRQWERISVLRTTASQYFLQVGGSGS
jgi:hypothetical protein